MPKGKKCLVKYCKTYESMRQTSLEVMQIICKDYLPSYEYLKSKFPDEAANRGGRFIKHPAIIKKESDLEEFEKSPHSRFFYETPIYLEKDGFNIVVTSEWNEENFSEFCKIVNDDFNIEITILD